MQFDIHLSPRGAQGATAYLLDVQADLLDDFGTRVVVPLVPADAFGRRAQRLHPTFEIGGQTFVMATHLLGAIRISELGGVVTSLRDHRAEIIAAIDVVLAGV